MDFSWQNIKNNIDFFIRKHFPLSRKNYFEENEDKISCFNTQNLFEREKFLFEKYDLDFLKSNSTRQNYLENLYLLDILDSSFPPLSQPLSHKGREEKKQIKVLDIGCKNWFYVKGEHAFFKKYCQNLQLDGIEIDVNRLYSNLFSRKEVAKFYIKGLKNVNYLEEDFLEVNEKYDYIVWILPFVVEYPHLRWGLPKRYFQPEKMLKHACNSLNDNGKLFIINQGETEYNVQKELCKKLDIKYQETGEIKSEFFNYVYPRYSLVIENTTKE